MANEILKIRNLRISFKTPNGKVQAVRGIDLNLRRGETLAIVGESGSGKSVTARSIMRILAPNALVEDGEIIYDGTDILKADENYMQKIRGEKIAMIFQDPLSSLNPIKKIGKQLTEAMIIKGRQRRKTARRAFNSRLALINKLADIDKNSSSNNSSSKNDCNRFNAFETLHVKLESAYEEAQENAEYALLKLTDISEKSSRNLLTKSEFRKDFSEVTRLMKHTENEFVVTDTGRMNDLLSSLKHAPIETVSAYLGELTELVQTAVDITPPDFFYLAFCRLNGNPEFPHSTMDELNAAMRQYLVSEFMSSFEKLIARASEYEYKRSIGMKKQTLALINDESRLGKVILAEKLKISALKSALRPIYRSIEKSKNRFDSYKDSREYSFKLAMKDEIETYLEALKYNRKTVKKGADANLLDIEALRGNIKEIRDNLVALYSGCAAEADEGQKTGGDADAANAIIDMLKAEAQDYARKVTRRTAKFKAIKIMDEVGISEPHKRFKQYPFEFSGGMRQRIVIAIALSADPEILICDEPTTALDVTIQGQILELINDLKERRNISVVFITHDLGVVANMADYVSVMYAGKIVEIGTAEDVFYNPLHPYTWALLSSMPDLETKEELVAIPGTPPNMIHPPKGDAFAERNRYALEIDFEEMPPLIEVSKTHAAATWLLHPDAPKVSPPAIVTERIERMHKNPVSEEADS